MGKRKEDEEATEQASVAALHGADAADRRTVYQSVATLVQGERTRMMHLVGLAALVLVLLLIPSLSYPRPGDDLLPVCKEVVWVPPVFGFAIALTFLVAYRRSVASYRYWLARLRRLESGFHEDLRVFVDGHDLGHGGVVVTWKGRHVPEMRLYQYPSFLPQIPTAWLCNLLFVLATSGFFALAARALTRVLGWNQGWLQAPWPFIAMFALLFVEGIFPRLAKLGR
jgi:hypothetical protein